MTNIRSKTLIERQWWPAFYRRSTRWGCFTACLSKTFYSALFAFIFALTTQAVGAAPLDALVKAVKFDDVKAVKHALEQGVDPNSVDNYGYPLLTLAAREKSDKVAATLLEDARIDPERENKAGENALMLAAINNDESMVTLLLQHGAKVSKPGWAPLHYAASAGADNIVEKLLAASAPVDAESPNGTTPLMMAARAGHVSTAKILLAHGAQAGKKNRLGLSALDFARRYQEKDVADLLASGTNSTAP